MADHSKDEQKQEHTDDSELTRSGGSENASANRGGTTDMDQSALTVDRDDRIRRGSGASTKNNVTGSDFDGQLSE